MVVSLTLRVVSHPDGLEPPKKRMSFDGEAVSIGRQDDNDFVLPDDSQSVSRRHALVERVAGGFRILDQSTNGIWINEDDEPIDPDEPRLLKNGDRLSIGDYVVEVILMESKPVKLDLLDGDPFADRPDVDEEPVEAPSRPAPVEPDEPRDVLRSLPEERSIMGGGGQRPVIPDDEPIEPPRVGPQHHHFDRKSFSDTPSAPAKPAGETGGLIPDDWDLDDAPDEAPDQNGAPADVIPEDALEPDRPDPPPAAKTGVSKDRAPRVASKAARPVLPTASGVQTDELTAEEWRRLGGLVRTFLDGLHANLATVAEIEETFRVSSPANAGRMRNPLKSASSIDEALVCLLQDPKDRYLSMEDSVVDACHSLSASQDALRDALEMALTDGIERLNPDKVERDVKDQSGGVMAIALGTSGTVWSELKTRHAEMRRLLDDDMQELCGRAFAQSYERAVEIYLGRLQRPKS